MQKYLTLSKWTLTRIFNTGMKLNAWVSFTLYLLKTINVLVTEWSIVITFKYVQNLYLIVLSHRHCDRLKKVWKLVMCTILYHSRYFNESQYVIIQIIDTDGWTFFLRLSQTKHHHRRGKSRDDDDEFETLFLLLHVPQFLFSTRTSSIIYDGQHTDRT